MNNTSYSVSEWDNWIAKNTKNLEHPAGYELQFVNEVLRKISIIKPSDVIAQYYFKDNAGKNRYIDFYIKNDNQKLNLPIELDGFWKVKNYNDFNDMMSRQNSIITQFKILLRYTNRQMQDSPDNIIKEIETILRMQVLEQDTTKIENEIKKNQLEEYKTQIKNLENQLKEQKNHPLPPTVVRTNSNSTFKKLLVLCLLVVACTYLLYNFILQPYIFDNQLSTTTHYITNHEKEVQIKSTIDASQANQFVGTYQIVCGQLIQIKRFSKGLYLNMGKMYPNQDITIIIWNSNIDKFEKIYKNIGLNQCIFGRIISHQGTPQLMLNNINQIK